MAATGRDVTSKLGKLIWIVLVALLPVTSMPLIVRLTGASAVASPSLLFLAIFMLVWMVPAWIKGLPVFKPLEILFFFAFFAIASALIFFLSGVPGYKESSPARAVIEAIVTLLIGISFFLSTAYFNRQHGHLRLTLTVIDLSGVVLIGWCLLQAVSWYGMHAYPDWLRTIHEFFSIGPLFRQRVNGFALEPSWLAHQLNMLYLPLWLAASVTGQSAFGKRLGRISLENLLLAGGIATLLLTLSRAGYVAFLLMLIFLGIRAVKRLDRWLQRRRKASSRLASLALYASLIALLLLFVGGFAFIVSKFDPRMGALFAFNLAAENPILEYANKLLFSSRVVYWQAGWRLFEAHSWFGVGLGLAGFYLQQYLSGYASRLVEVQTLLYHSDVLLNIKSLWVRLLAETGMTGFSLFVLWLLALAGEARKILRIGSPFLETFAYAGIFGMLAFIVEGFSIDSFALPYLWITTGLLVAAANQAQ